jgi:hypothetical protein
VIPAIAAAVVVGNTFALLRGGVWLSSRGEGAAISRIPVDDLRVRPQRVGLFWVSGFGAWIQLRFITRVCWWILAGCLLAMGAGASWMIFEHLRAGGISIRAGEFLSETDVHATASTGD